MLGILRARAQSIWAALALGALIAAPGQAQPVTPTYTVTFSDATTYQNQTLKSDGKYGWFITPGADSYQNEFYERPTTQSFETMTAATGASFVGAKEYYQNLDIASGRAGFDDTYLYVAINLVGLHNVTENGNLTLQGLPYEYMFFLALTGDGANGIMLVTDGASGTTYTSQRLTGYLDTNGDVGGSGLANGL